MKTKEAAKLGIQHANEGGELTPCACREIDAVFFAVAKKSDRPAKEYNRLRSAFNKAWGVRQYELC